MKRGEKGGKRPDKRRLTGLKSGSDYFHNRENDRVLAKETAFSTVSHHDQNIETETVEKL